MHHIAGIRIADSLRRKVQHQVQRHALANRIAVNAKLDTELGADLAGNIGQVQTKCQLDAVLTVPVGDSWPARLGALTDSAV